MTTTRFKVKPFEKGQRSLWILEIAGNESTHKFLLYHGEMVTLSKRLIQAGFKGK